MLLEKQKLPYDVIMGHNFMKELQMDVLYSEDVVVWGGVRLTMQKIQNGKWMDLNLMDQEYPKVIKEHSIRLGTMIDVNYKRLILKQRLIN